jgi:hypothetical protein
MALFLLGIPESSTAKANVPWPDRREGGDNLFSELKDSLRLVLKFVNRWDVRWPIKRVTFEMEHRREGRTGVAPVAVFQF